LTITGSGMITLQVWAPSAERVEVVLGGRGEAVRRGERAAYEMQPAPGGWWVHPDPVPAGTRYAFSVDGGPPRPDPRSLSQPDGVHEASELVDLTEHEWGDADWTGAPLQG